MQAIIFSNSSPITSGPQLLDSNLPDPVPKGRDLLVQVKAVSVNPIDIKNRAAKSAHDQQRVFGWDAAGVVQSIGQDVTLFKPGDEVFYAGDVSRPGCNSSFHLVDERIVGRKPATLNFAHAAGLPLTALTAWEGLFDRMGIDEEGPSKGKRLLVIGGAGGVGSIAIQLARLAGLEVLATASRAESISWVRELGATTVISHKEPLKEQLHQLGIQNVDYIACFNNMDKHWVQICELIAPQGKILSIVGNELPLDMNTLRLKSVTLCWEGMFTRPRFATTDMARQGNILTRVGALIDQGKLRSTVRDVLMPISAANMQVAYDRVGSGSMIGKLVLSGWPD